MLPAVEMTTESAVNPAPSAMLRSASSFANSGQKTSVMPAMPSSDPTAMRDVMGVPKHNRRPIIPRSGLAE
jgi:hypothetical protein